MENPFKKMSGINPQPEDGYRRLENGLFSAIIKFGFSASEYKIVLAVVHKSWGFGKDDDSISCSQFMGMTGLSERAVRLAVASLRESRVLVTGTGERVQKGSPLTLYMLNKHHDTWISRGAKTCRGAKKCIQRVQEIAPTKETLTKEKKKASSRKPKTYDLSTLRIPAYFLNDDEWPELWEKWQECRRMQKNPITLFAAEQQIKHMDEWGLGASIEALSNSISGNWKGLFKPKGYDLPTHDQYGPIHTDKQRQENIEWADKFYKEQEAKEKLAREEEERLYGNGEGRDQEGA